VSTPTHSATLMINELVQDKLAAGEKVVHLGFGEAGLPPLEELRTTLDQASRDTTYGKVVGAAPARAAVAGWFSRRGLPTRAEQILLAPGSKALLYGVLGAIQGAVILPQPSWVSYAAQAGLLGREVIYVPIPAEAGGVPDPALLRTALAEAAERGTTVGAMVLTLPDNPTRSSPAGSASRSHSVGGGSGSPGCRRRPCTPGSRTTWSVSPARSGRAWQLRCRRSSSMR